VIIAIDFDETYTRDPLLWDAFLAAAAARGHRLFCVSARHERQMDQVRETVGRIIGPEACFGTGGASKRRFMAETVDTHVDVWIDDAPESVVEVSVEVSVDLGGGLRNTSPEITY
jgi:hypothetical protein